jgi:hypothetical protein
MASAPPLSFFSAARPPNIPPRGAFGRGPRSYLIASGLMGALALPEVGSDAAVKRNS